MSANIDQLIEGVDQLDTAELETYVTKVSLLLAKRKAPSLSDQETDLLQTINEALPAEIETRHSELQNKIHDETITPAEHEELLKLIPLIEQAEVKRLEALFNLSQLRQVSLPEIMQQLGITPPPING